MKTVWADDAIAEVMPARPEPLDFDAFWADSLAESPAKADFKCEAVEDHIVAVDTFDLVFAGSGGAPISAWLHLPAGGGDNLPCVVQFIGYNGGRGLSHQWNTWATAGYAHLVMDTRGQGTGDCPGVTVDPVGSGPAAGGFLTRGIDHRDTYYYRRVFVDAVNLVDVARRLPMVDPSRIAVVGTSQGAGIAIAAAGLSDVPSALVADVPFLADFSRAVLLAETDPYSELTRYLASHRDRAESVFSVLDYFDVAHHAARGRVPALMSIAGMDSVCPPPTVQAVFNAYAGPKQLARFPFNDHEGGGAHFMRTQLAWLADLWRRR